MYQQNPPMQPMGQQMQFVQSPVGMQQQYQQVHAMQPQFSQQPNPQAQWGQQQHPDWQGGATQQYTQIQNAAHFQYAGQPTPQTVPHVQYNPQYAQASQNDQPMPYQQVGNPQQPVQYNASHQFAPSQQTGQTRPAASQGYQQQGQTQQHDSQPQYQIMQRPSTSQDARYDTQQQHSNQQYDQSSAQHGQSRDNSKDRPLPNNQNQRQPRRDRNENNDSSHYQRNSYNNRQDNQSQSYNQNKQQKESNEYQRNSYDNRQDSRSRPYDQNKQQRDNRNQRDRHESAQSNAPNTSASSKPGPSQVTAPSADGDNGSESEKSGGYMFDFQEMGKAVKKYATEEVSKGNTRVREEDEDLSSRIDSHPYRQTHGLVVWDDFRNEKVPEPICSFEQFPSIPQVQLKALYDAGFKAPTPIQAQTWPIAMKDRDVISIAKTGSGKTLAFLMPGYAKIDARFGGPRGTIYILVLAPTRELATQIHEEAVKFGGVRGHDSACAYGGAPKKEQLSAINQGISVLVATPGRLNDYLERSQVNLSNVFYLVLDEADRMLDMGFEPQIREIIKRLPRKRQTLMFSATWPEEVRRLANDFLYQPIHIRLRGGKTGLSANEDIRQHLILLNSGEDKDKELVQLIRSRFHNKRELVLIFVARKNTCDFVTNMLNRVGIQASAMHGDRDQEHRERVLNNFRQGSRPILVATDVASRGIDVKGISAVVNYDLANSTEDYVHRIGRTGRAGMAGESFTFITHSNDDVWKAQGIVEIMAKNGQSPPREVQDLIDRMKERSERNKERRNAESEQFMKVLIVAEKPSVAKMIAENLSNGRFRTRKGISRANQVFEFIKYFAPAKQKCIIVVTSVVGHIFGLTFVNQRVKDISTLFDSQVEKNIEENTKKLRIVEHLQALGSEAEFLFLWLDCDREGENIGFEVISLVADNIHYDNVYRARFSALTRTELMYAYDNPIRPDKYAAQSVDARQELDLKIGVSFSRLMTRQFLNMAKEKYRLKDQRVISFGPCQTPTLWFCAQRHKERQSFRSRQYFEVSLMVQCQGRPLRVKFQEDEVSPSTLKQIEKAIGPNAEAKVVEIKEQIKTVEKPLGLNTVTLLKVCSKGLGMSPTAAMNAAEHLYTAGFISYPRTETSRYPESFDLIAALQTQANHPHWGNVAGYILHSGRINPSRKGEDVGDHPPITPMMAATRNEISKGQEWKVYDYVTRHFLASLHDDIQYKERVLVLDVGGYNFSYTWHEMLDKGFLFAMPWKHKSLNLNEEVLPNANHLTPGAQLMVKNLITEEQHTKPPDYLQESDLIALMDKHGIGTDASIPQHIKNVIDRHYVDVCGPSNEDGSKGTIIRPPKFFGKNKPRGGANQGQERPTSRHMVPRGFGLGFLACFEDLDNELCEPSIRAYMEKEVSKIATGETEKSEVVSSCLQLFKDKFLYFRENIERVNKYFAPKEFGPDGQPIRNNSANYQDSGGYGGRGRGYMEGGRGGGGMNRGRGNMDRGRGNNDRGRGNMDRGRGNMDRGRGNMDRGGGNFNQGRGRGRGDNRNEGGFGNQYDSDMQPAHNQNEFNNSDNYRGRGGRGTNNRGSNFRGRGGNNRGNYQGDRKREHSFNSQGNEYKRPHLN